MHKKEPFSKKVPLRQLGRRHDGELRGDFLLTLLIFNGRKINTEGELTQRRITHRIEKAFGR